MTVIAYRNGVLASDSGVFSGELVVDRATKVWRIGNQLVAGCGAAGLADGFIDWLRDGGRDRPPPLRRGPHHAEVVVFQRGPGGFEGRWWTSDLGCTVLSGEYYAFGAARDVALGALHAGASAEGAVEAALAHHVYCCGPVQRVAL